MTLELTKQDIEAIITIINNASFQGSGAEFIVALKQKFIKALEPKEEVKE